MKKITILLLVILAILIFITVLLGAKKTDSKKQINKSQSISTPTPQPIPTYPIVTLNPTQKSAGNQQAIKDASFEKALEDFESKRPLLDLMPVKDPFFEIDYLGDLKYEIKLLGVDKEISKQKALDWWHTHGVDPTKLIIIWK